jgi:3-hydroxyisobutyrate dehydrogenase-like beta-hydroxyacid dehydrogenase
VKIKNSSDKYLKEVEDMITENGESNQVTIGIIGFGEVGQAFVNGLLENKNKVYVYDILLEKSESDIEEKIRKLGAIPVNQIEELAYCSEIVFSLVNSSSSIHVAKEISNNIKHKIIFIDFTTSTPQNKLESEHLISSKGGLYVDAAIMGTVATEQYKVPLLLSGEHANLAQKYLADFGLNCQAIRHPVGAASSIKLLRSIFMKGIEALLLETMITAKNYGVNEEVMDSISKTLNNNDFVHFGNALITTHMIHKNRRYKEVLDSLKLIKDANLQSYVTDGIMSFFANSVNIDVDKEILKSNNIEQILDSYITIDVIKN